MLCLILLWSLSCRFGVAAVGRIHHLTHLRERLRQDTVSDFLRVRVIGIQRGILLDHSVATEEVSSQNAGHEVSNRVKSLVAVVFWKVGQSPLAWVANPPRKCQAALQDRGY